MSGCYHTGYITCPDESQYYGGLVGYLQGVESKKEKTDSNDILAKDSASEGVEQAASVGNKGKIKPFRNSYYDQENSGKVAENKAIGGASKGVAELDADESSILTGEDIEEANFKGLTTDEMTGPEALKNMVFEEVSVDKDADNDIETNTNTVTGYARWNRNYTTFTLYQTYTGSNWNYVYLPAGYDENDSSKKYPVLYLMHGVGGTESEWGLSKSNSVVKAIMDKRVADKSVEPFIIVTPNGRSNFNFFDISFSNHQAFYSFGQELRNDLIPYIEQTFNVSSDRNHRAMAGLSMGGMQTINIGLCESLDLISWFGAFSAAPTSYSSKKIDFMITTYFDEYPMSTFYFDILLFQL